MTHTDMPEVVVAPSDYFVSSMSRPVQSGHSWLEIRYVKRQDGGADIYQFTAKIPELFDGVIAGDPITANPKKNVLDHDGQTILNDQAVLLASSSLTKRIKALIREKST